MCKKFCQKSQVNSKNEIAPQVIARAMMREKCTEKGRGAEDPQT